MTAIYGKQSYATVHPVSFGQRTQLQPGLTIVFPGVVKLFLQLMVFMGLLLSANSATASVQLYSFKMVQQENVMLHFDLDSVSATAELFMLAKPHRLVIDLPDTRLATSLPTETFSDGVVKGIRYAQHGDDYLRIVLDLRSAVSPTSRVVPRMGGQRLVVDLGVKSDKEFEIAAQAIVEKPPLRDAIVAIDAGHGGKDPGAIGAGKTREKDITLAIALKLHKRLQAQPGITPVLIRDGDFYVKLRDRIELASRNNADVFVSIHADAVKREAAQGSSVYTLSMDGATSEAAAWLAKSENESAALHGDVSLHGLDDTLRQTLLNLTQNNTLERSMEVGQSVLAELSKIGTVHKQSVEQAAFAVLKSPDIPSILVETAFISNREEEKKLNNPRYQDRVAAAIETGLANYLARRAPDGTHLATARRQNGS